MKKIISLIVMFALSVSFLAAQVTPLSYQAVMIDDEYNLVVEEAVTPTVAVTFNGGTYTETHEPITTSSNGLISINIGEGTPTTGSAPFESIDWSTATILVTYAADGHTFNNIAVPDQVEAVPYAVQASSFELTTDAIVEYLMDPNTTIEDVEQIIAAMDNENNLRDIVVRALVDTLKTNYLVARDVLLYYIQHVTPEQLEMMYNSISDEARDKILDLAVQYLKEHKEIAYTVLKQYVLHTTVADVDSIVAALPTDVKNELFNRAMAYMKTSEFKTNFVIPVMMDYVRNITTDEVLVLIETLKGNAEAYPILLNQFFIWMDEYFQDASHSATCVSTGDLPGIVNDVVAGHRFVDAANCNGVDLCQLVEDVNTLAGNSDDAVICPHVESISVEADANDHHILYITATIDQGTITFNGGEGKFEIEQNNESGDIYVVDATINANGQTMTATISMTGAYSSLYGKTLRITALYTPNTNNDDCDLDNDTYTLYRE